METDIVEEGRYFLVVRWPEEATTGIFGWGELPMLSWKAAQDLMEAEYWQLTWWETIPSIRNEVLDDKSFSGLYD